jgi:peptidoglycan/xylan/chitin deacetylase (PgdA/CDA1 family)
MWTGLISAAGLAGVAAWAVRGRSAPLLGPVTWRGPADQQAIALTFDDGPSESTPRLLDLLDEYQARATFFACGANVRRLPAIAREILSRGHELANHTESHAPLYLQPRDFIRRQVNEAQAAIAAATGIAPKLFRPPYGCRWPGLAGVLEEQDLRLVMWTAIGSDWRLPAPAVAAKLERAARPGAIFCLHDGRELAPNPDIAATLGAVRVIMPRLGGSGFRFPTVSQLICPTKSPNVSSR